MRRLNGLLASLFLTVGAWSLAGAGCASLEDAGCESDADCRFGRVCLEGICTGDIDSTNNSSNSGNSSTNNSTSVNNGTTANNLVSNNGSTGNNGTPCRPTGDCGDNLICGVDGVCVPFCEDSGGCSGDDVCIDNGCVAPRQCDLLSNEGDDVVCQASWVCESDDGMNNSEVGVICELGPAGVPECFCFDSGTGQAITFQPDGDIECESEAFLELANSACGLRVPTGG